MSNTGMNRLQVLSVEDQEIAPPLLLHLYGLRRMYRSTSPFEIVPVGDDPSSLLSGHNVCRWGSLLLPTQYDERTLLDLGRAIEETFVKGTPLYTYFRQLYSDSPSDRFLTTSAQIASLGPTAWR